MDFFDFRSDTVTKPTPAMREAMANAPVGDDVYGEDPTINQLQERAAELTGMEAGLFVSTGTMGNLVATLSHCQRGDEMILGNKAHIFLYEAGGMAALGGVTPHLLENQKDGTLKLADIEAAIRGDDPHNPITRMVSIENTQNRCGGAPLTPAYTNEVAELAHSRDLVLHIDGARIFNAAVSLGIDVKELTQNADSITFCLSKGLSAPVGSVLCGSKEFIRKAHRARKQVGGGMRQAGIIAAAGLVAFDEMIERMSEDHQRAKQLAWSISQIDGTIINLDEQYTNMVYFEIAEEVPMKPEEFVSALRDKNVLLGGTNVLIGGKRGRRFRMVTHAWITDEAVNHAVSAIKETLNI